MTTSADRAMVAQCITGNKWHDISADGKTTLCGHPVWPQSKKVGDVTCGLCLKRKDSDEKILSWLAENMFEGGRALGWSALLTRYRQSGGIANAERFQRLLAQAKEMRQK